MSNCEKIKTSNNKIKKKKAQCNLVRQTAKTSAFEFDEIMKKKTVLNQI